jgi:oligopeptide/dipeptide ABC transporter ATP-binding protein
VVEEGPTDAVFASPKHPYTWSLLRSLPRLVSDSREPLRPIEGMPPDLTALPSGCAFHPRCPFAVDRCARDQPALESIEGGQLAACWVTRAGQDLDDLERTDV